VATASGIVPGAMPRDAQPESANWEQAIKASDVATRITGMTSKITHW
jgi:hypothetical protein